MKKAKRLKRSEVPVEMTWDLSSLFEDREQWQVALKSILPEIEKFKEYKGRACQDGETLYKVLSFLEELSIKMVHLGTYARLKQAGDGTDSQNQEDVMAFAQVHARFAAATSFIESEIIALGEDEFKALFDNDDLKPYQRYLEEIYSKKEHSLAPDAEEVLASMSELVNAPYSIYQTSKAADLEFEPFLDSHGDELPNSFALFEGKYESDADTVIRRNSYKSFVKTLERYKNTYAAVYGTEVRKQVAEAKLRGYESVTHMLLDPQDVSVEMYENQLDIIFNELAPHMRKLAKIKKEQLGLEKMFFCDLKAPLPSSYNKPATIEDIKETIINALGVLGEDYKDMVKRSFDERWIDLADNIGKSTGAFCSSPYDDHPYILVTYTGNMRSAFLLAHELGHAGHFYNANREQRVFDVRPSRYFIEAPSTMNEMLLAQHLLSESDDKALKQFVIINLLGTYYHNFVTHLLEGEFQRRVYKAAEEGKALTAKMLCATKLAIIKEFWGDAVEIDEAAGMTWMRQPHYYMGLYPYTYSAGLTVSTLVSKLIAEEGQPVVDKWLKVLKAGGTMKPLELIKTAGIDMSNPEPIKEAVAHVGGLIDELGDLYKELQ